MILEHESEPADALMPDKYSGAEIVDNDIDPEDLFGCLIFLGGSCVIGYGLRYKKGCDDMLESRLNKTEEKSRQTGMAGS